MLFKIRCFGFSTNFVAGNLTQAWVNIVNWLLIRIESEVKIHNINVDEFITCWLIILLFTNPGEGFITQNSPCLRWSFYILQSILKTIGTPHIELVWLGSSRRLQNCSTDTEMSVLGSLIRPVDSVRDLGVLIDSGLTLSDHVNIESRRVVLLPNSTTSHRATNIDGWGCTLPGTSFHPQPDWLLQRYFGFQSEISHWEATVRASCRRQTRPTIAQSLAPFPLWCAINFTGWASNQEWSLSWLSWLTSRFTVGLRSTYLLTVFQCRVCQVAHIFDLLVSGPCSSPELRLRQSALGVFTVRALASGTPCLRLFVTSICHWRLSDRNWNFICLLLNFCKSIYS